MGAFSGMMTSDLTPRREEAHATPWAWLPEEAATTPLALSASVREDILLKAPLTLKEPVFWRFSSLSQTSKPKSLERVEEGIKGVRVTTPFILEAASLTRSIIGPFMWSAIRSKKPKFIKAAQKSPDARRR